MMILLLAAFTACGMASAQEKLLVDLSKDYSNRISICDVRTISDFSSGEEEWTATSGCTLSLADEAAQLALREEGNTLREPKQDPCLMLKAGNMPGNVWRGIRKAFGEPQDFRSTPVFQVSVFCPSRRPVNDVWVRIILSDGEETWEAHSIIIPEDWRDVTLYFGKCPFLGKVKSMEISVMNDTDKVWPDCRLLFDHVKAGRALDPEFSLPGSAGSFTAVNGKVKDGKDCLDFRFGRNASLSISKDLVSSRDKIFSPELQIFNTFFLVMANRSNSSMMRLCYTTTETSIEQTADFEVEPQSGLRAYYVNVSENPLARGRLTSLRLEPAAKAKGEILIDRLHFLREQPTEHYAGTIESCTSDGRTVTVKGSVKAGIAERFPVLTIYEAPLHLQDGKIDAGNLSGLRKCFEGSYSSIFTVSSIPYLRPDGKMTMLSSRLLAVVSNSNGEMMKVAPYFFIGNCRDLEPNPYSFDLPDREFNVLDYGAKGDGFTDDSKAIQKAIQACHDGGGGRVVLPGDLLHKADSAFGRRYVVTNIRILSKVDLHLCKGAVIWQSPDRRDYDYRVNWGHNMNIPGIPWTHCIYANKPMVQVTKADSVKLTGEGRIMPFNIPCENPEFYWLHSLCCDQMHVIPFGFHIVDHAEVSGVEVIYPPTYTCQFSFTKNLYISSLKLWKQTCTSGDGLGLANGTMNVKAVQVVYYSNDDGVTLTSSYGDPRNDISPWRYGSPAEDSDRSVRNIEVVGSYIDCNIDPYGNGGAHAIAFIPWGCNRKDLQMQQIQKIYVHDCVLKAPYAVGVWPDTPFDGKVFTNAERDNYSPMSEVRIENNEYLGALDMAWCEMTDWTGDTGIHSASHFLNGDFSSGVCSWTVSGDAGAVAGTAGADGCGFVRNDGSLMEGLYLEAGTYKMSVLATGSGKLVARDKVTGETVAEQDYNEDGWNPVVLDFLIRSTGDYLIGVVGGDTKVKDFSAERSVSEIVVQTSDNHALHSHP